MSLLVKMSRCLSWPLEITWGSGAVSTEGTWSTGGITTGRGVGVVGVTRSEVTSVGTSEGGEGRDGREGCCEGGGWEEGGGERP